MLNCSFKCTHKIMFATEAVDTLKGHDFSRRFRLRSRIPFRISSVYSSSMNHKKNHFNQYLQMKSSGIGFEIASVGNLAQDE